MCVCWTNVNLKKCCIYKFIVTYVYSNCHKSSEQRVLWCQVFCFHCSNTAIRATVSFGDRVQDTVSLLVKNRTVRRRRRTFNDFSFEGFKLLDNIFVFDRQFVLLLLT